MFICSLVLSLKASRGCYYGATCTDPLSSVYSPSLEPNHNPPAHERESFRTVRTQHYASVPKDEGCLASGECLFAH